MSERRTTTLSLLLGLLVIGCSVAMARADETDAAVGEGSQPQHVAVANGSARDVDPVSAWMNDAAETKEAATPNTLAADPSSDRFRPKKTARGSRGRVKLPSSGTDMLSLFWPLAIVLAMIVGLAILFRKYLPGGARLNRSGAIDVLASHYLSNKQSLNLIRIGRRLVLVGVTPDRISSVVEITEAEEVSEVVATIEKNRPESFTSTLARLYSGRTDDETPDEEIESDLRVPSERIASAGTNVRNLVERIRGLSAETSAEPT